MISAANSQSPVEMEALELGKTIAQRIPYRLLLRIEEMEKKEKFKSRTDAINIALEIGLIAYENKDVLKDDHLKEEILTQLREGGLVDYFRKMTMSDLQIIWSIIKNEMSSRNNNKIKG